MSTGWTCGYPVEYGHGPRVPECKDIGVPTGPIGSSVAGPDVVPILVIETGRCSVCEYRGSGHVSEVVRIVSCRGPDCPVSKEAALPIIEVNMLL